MSVTLEAIEEQQKKLSGMIASFKLLNGTFPATIQAPVLSDGEKYVGTIISADGTKKEHVILMPQKPDGKLNWQDANKWAESIGGKLPDRVEGALLFNQLKSDFEEEWHWTRESYTDSYAWYQSFNDGYQNFTHKYYELRARAVRSELVI